MWNRSVVDPIGFTKLPHSMIFSGEIVNHGSSLRGRSLKELDGKALAEAAKAERHERQHRKQCTKVALPIQLKYRGIWPQHISVLEHLEEVVKHPSFFTNSDENVFKLSRLITTFKIWKRRYLLFLLNIGCLLVDGHIDVKGAGGIFQFVLARLASLCLKVYTKECKKEFLDTTLFLGNSHRSIKLHLQRTGSFGLLRAMIQQERTDIYLLELVMKLLLESIPKACFKNIVYEILTLPDVFKRFRQLEKVFTGDEFGNDVVKTLTSIISQPEAICPDGSSKSQSVACLLNNILDISSILMPKLLPDTVVDLVCAAASSMTILNDLKNINVEPKMLETMVEIILQTRHGIWDDVVGSLFTLLQGLFRHRTDMDALYTQLSFGTNIIPTLRRFIEGFSHDHRVVLCLPAYCPLLSHKLYGIKREEIEIFSKADSLDLIHILKKAMWDALYGELQNLGLDSEVIDCIQREVGGLLNKLRDWFLCTSNSTSVFYCKETASDSFCLEVKERGSVSRKILTAAPLLVNLRSKLKLFKRYVSDFKSSHICSKKFKFRIRRSHMVRDALHLLGQLPHGGICEEISVVFYNVHGMMEPGHDAGGLFKEMVSEVFKLVCNANNGLFEETEDHQFYPNRNATSLEELQNFRSLGRLLGKAISEGVPLDQEFALFFCKKLKKKYSSFSDMLLFDKNIYNSLCLMKSYDEETILGMGSDFEELIPNGAQQMVTRDNIIMYAHLKANDYLNTKIQKQASYFLGGLHEIIQPRWLEIFDEEELQILISGTSEVDVEDLKNNTTYEDFQEDDRTIQLFWEVVEEISAEDKKKLLRFVTSCPRVPAGGFQYLKPRFKILRFGDDVERLPTASTCSNILMIPSYDRKDQLQEKLKTAIDSGVGFGLY